MALPRRHPRRPSLSHPRPHKVRAHLPRPLLYLGVARPGHLARPRRYPPSPLPPCADAYPVAPQVPILKRVGEGGISSRSFLLTIGFIVTRIFLFRKQTRDRTVLYFGMFVVLLRRPRIPASAGACLRICHFVRSCRSQHW